MPGKGDFTKLLSVEALNAIMDVSYQGIYLIDCNERIVYMNSWASEYLEIPSRDAIGRNVNDYFPNSKLANSMKTGTVQTNQLTEINRHKIIVTRIPIFKDGKVLGAVAVFQDVMRVQENEMELRSQLFEKGLVARHRFEDIVHDSQSVGELISIARAYARTDSPILIYGESGTGKELFAQSIHSDSKRSDGPFVAINCAALTESILDSELFGYSEASFTGAKKGGKMGLFQQAHRGTIFLDEIGEMSMSVQSKLLRVIQEKQVRPIGGDRVIPVDVRIIAATHRNLSDEVSRGAFRLDLMYRMNVLQLHIPPLRDRREDIPALCKHYFRSKCHAVYAENKPLIHGIIHQLEDYSFPGNVRELENILERLTLLIQTGILPADPKRAYKRLTGTNGIPASGGGAVGEQKYTLLEERERENIINTLLSVNGSRALAADALNISETTLWRKMKKYQIHTKRR